MSPAGRVDEPVDDRAGAAGLPGDDVLDVGEEVTRLTETLAAWWSSVTDGPSASQRSAQPTADDDTVEHGGEGADDTDRPWQTPDGAHTRHGSGTGESCRVCPVCRVLDIVRAARPELLRQVATAAETVALLLREAAAGDSAREPGEAPSRSGGPDLDEEEPPGAHRRPRGTPIVVRDLDGSPTPSDEQLRRGTPWD